MPENLEARVEKLETKLAALSQDYLFLSAIAGISIGFIKNLHHIVDLSENTTARVLAGWTTEVDKRDSISDLFRDIKKRAEGDSNGPSVS